MEVEKGVLANPKLVEEWRSRRGKEVGETTAKMKAIQDEEMRGIDLLRKVPVEADGREVAIRTGLRKGKRGRLKRVQRAQETKDRLGSASEGCDERKSIEQREDKDVFAKDKSVYSKDKDVVSKDKVFIDKDVETKDRKKREEMSSLGGPRWRKGEAC